MRSNRDVDIYEHTLDRMRDEIEVLRGIAKHANNEVGRIGAELEKARAERDHWKANHDNMAAMNRLLRDRPDLGDRARSVQALIAERDRAVSALRTNRVVTRSMIYVVSCILLASSIYMLAMSGFTSVLGWTGIVYAVMSGAYAMMLLRLEKK
jgi:hypothetical protein